MWMSWDQVITYCTLFCLFCKIFSIWPNCHRLCVFNPFKNTGTGEKHDPHKFTVVERLWSDRCEKNETFFPQLTCELYEHGSLFSRQLLWPRPSHRLHSMCSFHFGDGPSVQNGSMRQQSGLPSLRIHTSSNLSQWLMLGRLRFFLSFFFFSQ